MRTTHAFRLGTEADTQMLAERCASAAQIGDIFLLKGDIGAGKSTFARAFIRSRLDNRNEDVPSPTFTLVQSYEHPDGDIWHCDLYRLTHPDEVIELGLEEAFASAICLIEWPDRLGGDTPDAAIELAMTADHDGHSLEASGPSQTMRRLGLDHA